VAGGARGVSSQEYFRQTARWKGGTTQTQELIYGIATRDVLQQQLPSTAEFGPPLVRMPLDQEYPALKRASSASYITGILAQIWFCSCAQNDY